MMNFELLRTFFKIGLFTIGGGYAMIPMLEAEIVDKHKWVNREEFLDLIAVAQSCPGVFAINMSTFVGYKLGRTWGAVCSTLGAALPSFVIILLLAMFFKQIEHVAWVQAMFRGIRPAVVALIAAPTFTLAKSAHITLANCWIPIASALLIWLMGVNPVFIILAAGLGGYLYGVFLETPSEVSSRSALPLGAAKNLPPQGEASEVTFSNGTTEEKLTSKASHSGGRREGAS